MSYIPRHRHTIAERNEMIKSMAEKHNLEELCSMDFGEDAYYYHRKEKKLYVVNMMSRETPPYFAYINVNDFRDMLEENGIKID